MEALLAQCKNASVLMINRSRDHVLVSSTDVGPVVCAPLRRIEGYHPKECNHPPGAEFEPLIDGERLKGCFVTNGPMKEQLLLQLAFGELDLFDLCAKATQMGVSVLFLGEWDASLSYACARHAVSTLPLPWQLDISMASPRNAPQEQVESVRVFNGWGCTFHMLC